MSSTLTWEGAPSEWAQQFCRAQLWRTLPLFDLDDLMQESWLLWARCVELYNSTDQDSLFAMFKVSVIRRIHTIARRRRSTHHTDYVDCVDESAINCSIKKVDAADWYSKLPSVVQKVLRSFESCNHHRQIKATGRRETTSQLLCRLAGVEDSPLVELAVRRWCEQL